MTNLTTLCPKDEEIWVTYYKKDELLFFLTGPAGMPSTLAAIQQYLNAGILYGPAKAANAGGVSVSQLEMAQNAHMVHWTFDEVDNRLKGIMHSIYTRAAETAKEFGSPDNLLLGANISAFREVADAMILQGDY